MTGFLTGVVNDYKHRTSKFEPSIPGDVPLPSPAKASPQPPPHSAPAYRPRPLHTTPRGVVVYQPRGTPLTHAQIASYLQPSPRLSRRQMHAAQKQWREAQMYNWLTQKAGHYVPRSSLNEEKKAALRECFNLMDADGSGEIDQSELSIAMKALGFGKAEIREAIQMGDHDGDGSLDFDEFASLIMQASSKGKSEGTSQDAEGSNFPFALVADSYRITRLVDSYRPATDAALGIEDSSAPSSPSNRPASAASVLTPPATPRAGGSRASSARHSMPASPRGSAGRMRKADGANLPSLTPGQRAIERHRRPATAIASPGSHHDADERGVRFSPDGGSPRGRPLPASAHVRRRL